MRSVAPWLSLASTCYYLIDGNILWNALPDFALVLDAPVFYFRNEKQGYGPCADAACPWGPMLGNRTRPRGCLAGDCADATAINIIDEVADIAAGIPSGRALLVGFYATGHSTMGTPSPTYVARILDLLQLLMADASSRVSGVIIYTTKAPLGPCTAPPLFNGDEGCIVAAAFDAMTRLPPHHGTSKRVDDKVVLKNPER